MNKRKNGKLPKWAIFVIIGLSLFAAMPLFLFIGVFAYVLINEVSVDNYLEINGTVKGYYDDKSSTYFITGHVKNISTKDIDDIRISYVLYDEDNSIVGEADAYLEELDEGKTWKFTVSYTGNDAKDVIRFEKKAFDYENVY